MKVDRVTVAIRYINDSGKGAWKAVELGAEAMLAPDEDWPTAQGQLYHQLGQQMKALWANGSGKAQHGPEKPVDALPSPPPPPAPPRAHWCQQHRVEYRRYEKQGRAWYSHRVGDGWCKE
jgi:hypothetical protein